MKNAESPAAYLAGLGAWQRTLATSLRNAVRKAATLDERIKWGHLVYSGVDGPVCLIRAEPDRVLFGFWRGQRLRHLEPRLKAGGKYEMATLALTRSSTITPKLAGALVAEAVSLNASLGDPTDLSLAKAQKLDLASNRRAGGTVKSG